MEQPLNERNACTLQGVRILATDMRDVFFQSNPLSASLLQPGVCPMRYRASSFFLEHED